MDAATKAATALQKAQATAIYAGLGLWPKPVMAGLVAGQLAENGIYPDAGAAFEAAETEGSPQLVRDYSPDQPRDPQGRWTEGARSSSESAGESANTEASHSLTIGPAASQRSQPAEPAERPAEGMTAGLLGTVGSTAPSSSWTAPHAPDGTPIELAGAHGKGRARAIAGLAFGVAKLAHRIWRYFEREEPDPAGTVNEPTGGMPERGPSSSDNRISLPETDSQLKHILRNDPGHLVDTEANRMLLEDIANDPKNILGPPDVDGNSWFAKQMPDESQVWVGVRNGRSVNGGRNLSPRVYNPQTGLSSPTIPPR